MAGGDFYSRDRPDNPRLEEDRPRGGGPEDRPRTGHRHFWIWCLALAVIIVLLWAIFW
ncbi:hypothetical protein [Streptomyces collinus]|uniref:Integral membrane protein n=1 Tax=Streptomyces collinus (strain DSM 40733 / Tue 365) TaxID=1214242 RepID=S5UKM2_STRC3|nr:hypothetical protein [Streptomyces collinus]AGS67393.1 hypothetical protein B446_02805 [Streptomyces collinus Tu 365]